MKKTVGTIVTALSFCVTSLASNEPLTFKEAFSNHKKTIHILIDKAKMFSNRHQKFLYTLTNAAKIGAGFSLATRSHILNTRLMDHMKNQQENFIHVYSETEQQRKPSLNNAWVNQNHIKYALDGKALAALHKRPLGRLPQWTPLTISIYLIADGIRGIYHDNFTSKKIQ